MHQFFPCVSRENKIIVFATLAIISTPCPGSAGTRAVRDSRAFLFRLRETRKRNNSIEQFLNCSMKATYVAFGHDSNPPAWQKSPAPFGGRAFLSNLYTKDARLSSHYTAFFYAIFTTKKELLSLYSIKRANRATQKTYDLLHASPAKTSSMSQSSKREQILDASIRNRCI